MTDTAPSERLRHGALAMLADGNSVEAVAGMLGLPVAAVRGWQALPDRAPANDAARPRAPVFDFTGTLSHGLSFAARATLMVAMAVTLAAVSWALEPIVRRPSDDVDRWVSAGRGIAFTVAYVIMVLGAVRRQVVLDAHSVVFPRAFGSQSMPDAEIAGYTLEPGTRAGYQASFKGRWLTLVSRRPGAATMRAWIFDQSPFDPRIVDRLDAVVLANRGLPTLAAAPARPPTPAPALSDSVRRW